MERMRLPSMCHERRPVKSSWKGSTVYLNFSDFDISLLIVLLPYVRLSVYLLFQAETLAVAAGYELTDKFAAAFGDSN